MALRDDIRYSVLVQGHSQRAAAKRFGIARDTLARMLGESAAEPELLHGSITVAGQLCTPKDILARDSVVDRVRIGDVILFTYAGAYGWAISHHDFLSHPHPEQIYLD